MKIGKNTILSNSKRNVCNSVACKYPHAHVCMVVVAQRECSMSQSATNWCVCLYAACNIAFAQNANWWWSSGAIWSNSSLSSCSLQDFLMPIAHQMIFSRHRMPERAAKYALRDLWDWYIFCRVLETLLSGGHLQSAWLYVGFIRLTHIEPQTLNMMQGVGDSFFWRDLQSTWLYSGFIRLTHIGLKPYTWCRVLETLLSGGDLQSAALLTPYNGQVRELQRRFSGSRQLAAYEGMVDISSVDGYQVGFVFAVCWSS